MVFDPTPGGAQSNSYVTVEEARVYFTTRLHSELWDPFMEKEAALVTATKLLDRYVDWHGYKATRQQALHWPARDVVDHEGYYVPFNIIPNAVKEAVFEMAYYILEEDPTAVSDMDGLHSLKVGSLHIVADHKNKSSAIPEAVMKVVGEYGQQLSSSQIPVVRC